MSVPFEQGRPIWVDDDRFDIALPRAPHRAARSPGSREQLLALTARIQAQLLDRTRPLWELWFVEGLEGGHVGADPEDAPRARRRRLGRRRRDRPARLHARPDRPRAAAWVVEPRAEPAAGCFVDTLVERTTEPAEMARTARAPGARPRSARRRGPVRSGARCRSARRPQLDRAAHVVQRRRSAAAAASTGVRVSLDDVKAIRARARRHRQRRRARRRRRRRCAGCSSRAATTSRPALRALCPVSVRDDSEHMQLGNRVSAMFVELPVGEPDPVARLDAIRRDDRATSRSGSRRSARRSSSTSRSTRRRRCSGSRPGLAHRQPFFNLVVTNVPGPAGAALLHGRPDARGVPGGAAVREPRRSGSRSCRTAGSCTSALRRRATRVADLAVLAAGARGRVRRAEARSRRTDDRRDGGGAVG